MDFAAVLIVFNLSSTQVAVYALLPFITMGLVAIARGAHVPDPFLPVLSVLFGIVLSILTSAIVATPPIAVGVTVLLGIIVGLMASGIWSGGKTIGKAL